jgi:hypothetical protein
MKLKCIDGKIREFSIAIERTHHFDDTGARCLNCGYDFGVHNTKILKEQFKNHVCKGGIK